MSRVRPPLFTAFFAILLPCVAWAGVSIQGRVLNIGVTVPSDDYTLVVRRFDETRGRADVLVEVKPKSAGRTRAKTTVLRAQVEASQTINVANVFCIGRDWTKTFDDDILHIADERAYNAATNPVRGSYNGSYWPYGGYYVVGGGGYRPTPTPTPNFARPTPTKHPVRPRPPIARPPVAVPPTRIPPPKAPTPNRQPGNRVPRSDIEYFRR